MTSARTLKSQKSSGTKVTWIAVAVVVVVLVAIVSVDMAKGSPVATSSNVAVAGWASPSVVDGVTGVSSSIFNAVGVSSPDAKVTSPMALRGQTPLVSGGRPEIFFLGAEFCPYCAAERWPLTVALSRFGTFSHLGLTASAPFPEAYPATPTLDFYRSTYSSKYVVFVSVESENRSHQPLMNVTAGENRLMTKYDNDTYVPGLPLPLSIPFLDLGNRFLQVGASFQPSLLQGLTQTAIATGLSDSTSPVTQAIVASANQITADICSLTKGRPGTVCRTPGVQAANRSLGLSK